MKFIIACDKQDKKNMMTRNFYNKHARRKPRKEDNTAKTVSRTELIIMNRTMTTS